MATLQLSNADARLVYLALQYHLSRPGAELEREPGQEPAGLAGVSHTLEGQLERAVAEIQLGEQQQQRLDSALAGAINELKSSPLMEAGGRGTMVPAFRQQLERLYPEAARDAEEALRLAGHMLVLRRRLEQVAGPAAGETERKQQQKPRWRFWRRG